MPGKKFQKVYENKGDKVVENYIFDLKKNDTEGVHIGRVLKMLGNGRIEVVYSIKEKDKATFEGSKGMIAQAFIPGRFSGKGKGSSFVNVGSYVLVSDTGVIGSAALEMIALISAEKFAKIKDIVDIDPRLLTEVTDKTALEEGNVSVEDGFEFAQAADRARHRAPVGQGSPQPAVVHIVLGATPGGLGDRIGRLALGAHKQDAAAAGGDFTHLHQGLVKQGDRLREIDDVDIRSAAENVAFHLRVPAVCLVTEVGAGFKQLTHREIGERHGDGPLLPVSLRR